jgi:hypothetical protein
MLNKDSKMFRMTSSLHSLGILHFNLCMALVIKLLHSDGMGARSPSLHSREDGNKAEQEEEEEEGVSSVH